MKINGHFRYKPIADVERDKSTGFINTLPNKDLWIDGCECQLDRIIPAKHHVGTDGQEFSYSYDMFIPPHFDSQNLSIGTDIEVTRHDGSVETFTVGSIDRTPKYIELWG